MPVLLVTSITLLFPVLHKHTQNADARSLKLTTTCPSVTFLFERSGVKLLWPLIQPVQNSLEAKARLTSFLPLFSSQVSGLLLASGYCHRNTLMGLSRGSSFGGKQQSSSFGGKQQAHLLVVSVKFVVLAKLLGVLFKNKLDYLKILRFVLIKAVGNGILKR